MENREKVFENLKEDVSVNKYWDYYPDYMDEEIKSEEPSKLQNLIAVVAYALLYGAGIIGLLSAIL